jgi:hypothetical protein
MRINLVQGRSAAGLLRQACRQFGLLGEVHVVDDDLSVGPLYDDITRNKWWANVRPVYPEVFQPNLYVQWQLLSETLDRRQIRELAFWSSDSARDYVFDRMMAFMLTDYTGDVFKIRVPAAGKLAGVGFISPEALVACEHSKCALTSDERTTLALSFEHELRRSEGIRRLEDDGMTALPDDALDQYLLDRCPPEWTKWFHVIGEAMSDSDGRNLIGDGFFSWRLSLLVEARRVEQHGAISGPDSLKEVLVRRAGKN